MDEMICKIKQKFNIRYEQTNIFYPSRHGEFVPVYLESLANTSLIFNNLSVILNNAVVLQTNFILACIGTSRRSLQALDLFKNIFP